MHTADKRFVGVAEVAGSTPVTQDSTGFGRHLGRFADLIPTGGSLPANDWQLRHRALLALLWLNVVGAPIYALLAGYPLLHSLLDAMPVAVFALPASMARFSRKMRSAFVSLGLLTGAAVLIHLSDGLLEMHFLFFVLIVALTLYEDWLAFGLAVGYVLVHHGVMGTLMPEAVYNRPEAWEHPVRWAIVHAAFVGAAGLVALIAWRLNEHVRQDMLVAKRDLAELAETDSLTGLGNRRRAMADIGAACEAEDPDAGLVLLDLNGFKAYNDSFGHPAGDSLLERLGAELATAADGRARAYRLGGDEFCLLVGSAADVSEVELVAREALSESGEGFSISASSGTSKIPAEAMSASSAIQLADTRMYEQKAYSRTGLTDESKQVLLQALVERYPDLEEHLDEVTELAERVGRESGMSLEEIDALRHAAELHDIGKVAIPDAILSKPGPLDASEWEFMRRHTLIGERIVSAAVALRPAGQVVRSSHERWDGKGYPDGLGGEQIPLGARIVAVCDAYHAMTADRVYRQAMGHADAMDELRRCAGTQFDPAVVEVFEHAIATPGARSAVVATERLAIVGRSACPGS